MTLAVDTLVSNILKKEKTQKITDLKKTEKKKTILANQKTQRQNEGPPERRNWSEITRRLVQTWLTGGAEVNPGGVSVVGVGVN